MRYLFVFLLAVLTGVSYAQSENARQPSCNEIDGIIIQQKYFVNHPRDFEGYKSFEDFQNAERIAEQEKLNSITKDYAGFIIYCVDGRVKKLMEIKNGMIISPMRWWYANGQLRMEMHMENGIWQSSKEWYENGNLKEEVVFEEFPEKIAMKKIYDSNGQIEASIERNGGKLNGWSREWWGEEGMLREEKHWKDGIADGIWRKWYRNGQLEFEYNFKDGEGNGLQKKWHKNGQLEMSINVLNGKVMSAKCYYQNGRVEDCSNAVGEYFSD